MQRLISLLLCLSPLTAFATEASTVETSQAVTLIPSDPSRVALSFNYSALTCEEVTENSQNLEQMVIEGEGFFFREGQPILPAVSRLVVIPPDKSVELVVREGEVRRVRANLPLVRCNEDSLTEQDQPPDNSTELIPPFTAEMSDPIVIRGVRLVQVTTYPVQFDPQTQTYIIRDNLEAELCFGDAEPLNPAFYPERRNRSKTFLKFIRGLAINGDIVGRDDPDYDVDPPYIGHYLVVVHASVLQWAVPFIEWRRKAGYKVDILSVPANQASNDNWIKTQIQDIYNGYLADGIDPFDLLMLIGDHSGYGGNAPRPTNVISTPYYGWNYACLEGGNNDLHADVGLSQWIAGDESQMTLNSGRTLGYEMTPFFGNVNWLKRGALFSQRWGGNWHVSLHTNVRWGREVLKRHNFDDVRFYESFNGDGGGAVSGFIVDQFNAGVNMLMGRAQANGLSGQFANVRGTGIYPIFINYAGHQENMTWSVMRIWDGQTLKGPVAATNIYGAPQTFSNSLLWLESVNALIQQDLPFGWARVNAIMAPELYIPNFPQNAFNRQNVSFYGDPGLQPWLGVPKVVQVEFPRDITSTTRRVDVRVIDDEDDSVFKGAQVTLYFPGQMPAANQAAYATYDQMFMQTRESDEDGLARFVFEDGTEFVNGTRMYVTVTGRKVKPVLGDRVIGVPASALELDGYELAELEGNGDEFPNPGELFSLRLRAMNTGNSNSLRDVTASVSTISPYLQVAGEQISFGDIAPGDESDGDHPLELMFSPDCPDGVSRPAMRPSVLIEFASGDRRWESAIKLLPHSPHFEISRIVGGAIIPDSSCHLEIEIKNVGSVPSNQVSARLVSLGTGVMVVGNPSTYGSLNPGQNGRLRGDPFTAIGNNIVAPGTITPMQMILTDDLGFTDTASFTLQVRTPRARAPQGPDAYGYICYDDTDSGWFSMPQYEWVEIDPRSQEAEFEGERLDFDGQSQLDIGEALVVELPFPIKFYGIDFDEITVATNGFIAVGNQEPITNFQNWPLDRGIGGGAGMIAPFWDNLNLGQNGGIYSFHDEESGRFIIEWSRLRHRANGNVDLIFEVSILNPEIWFSETGDPNILFQYKSISNGAGEGGAWVYDAPYASVGISSPFGNSGINYSFNNQYPVTSAPLENRRAILFSTSPLWRASYLYGRVTDAGTGQPVPQALIRTLHGYVTHADDEGNWNFSFAPSNIPFDITASKMGYNDSTYTGLEVANDDTLEINFDLLHPEFVLSNDAYSVEILTDNEIEERFTLSNIGNGSMVWTAEKRLIGDANAAPRELRRSYNVSQITGDERIEGVVFDNDYFYLSGANGDFENLIYIMDREGELQGSFPQVGSTRYGYKDMEWDGRLIWAVGQDSIYALNSNGEVEISWEDPLNPSQYIGYDQDHEILFLSGSTTNIARYDRQGNRLGEDIARLGLRIYGLTYWRDDPDGYGLYILNRPFGNATNLTKMNVDTGDSMFVLSFDQAPSSLGQMSAMITNLYDIYSWVFLSLQNIPIADGGDKLDIHQMEARKDWMDLDIYGGRMEAGEFQDLILTIDAVDLPETTFVGEMLFHHNSDSGVAHLGIELTVLGIPALPPFHLLSPANGDTVFDERGNRPEVRFVWEQSVNPSESDSAITYVQWFRMGPRSVHFTVTDTFNIVDLDTIGLPPPFDIPLTWWVAAVAGQDTNWCFGPFRLRVLPLSTDLDPVAPVEFGLNSIYPSPFNSITSVRFGIERPGRTMLSAYDVFGRQVAILYKSFAEAGQYQVSWDAGKLSTGVYILRLESGGRESVQKIALIR